MRSRSSGTPPAGTYPVTLYPAEEGGFVAEHRDLPGCITQGESLAEALANLDEARELWIATAVENGDEVPFPSTDQRFGGRVLVRMTKSLHRRLVERADREGVSTNQFIVSLLAEGLGTCAVRAELDRILSTLRDVTRVVDRTAEETARLADENERLTWSGFPDQMAQLVEAWRRSRVVPPEGENEAWPEIEEKVPSHRGTGATH